MLIFLKTIKKIWSETDNFFVILGGFLPFYPPNSPKKQNFEKMKKNACKYYHFTHVYHKGHHMMHGS